MTVLPMFPLGSVLLPGAVLPLHVFEPRYRALVQHCLESDDHEFGVVLIDRGHEVGGGDVRRPVGTVARMLQVAELEGGRYAVVAVGTRRIRVIEWLPDDPFPRAEVDDWRDDEDDADLLPDVYRRVTARVRRTAALAIELGDPAGDPSGEVSPDPLVGSYQLAVLAPLGGADEYDLLCAAWPLHRLEMLERRLDDVDAAQRFRLTSSAGGPDELNGDGGDGGDGGADDRQD
ncbi:MAG: peptidase family protein [Ilumatobacteraceae bacterium]|nr:peptidase family protein [Ilumatobacteraceae bacterium]